MGPGRREDSDDDKCGCRSDTEVAEAVAAAGGGIIAAALASAFLAVRLDRRGMSPSFSSYEPPPPPRRPTLPPHSTAAALWCFRWLGWWFSATTTAPVEDGAATAAASMGLPRWGGVAYADSVDVGGGGDDDDAFSDEADMEALAAAVAAATSDDDDDERRSRALKRMASRDLGSNPFTSLFSSVLLGDAEGDDDGGGGGGGEARGFVDGSAVMDRRGCSTFSLRARAASKPVFSGRFGSSCEGRSIPLSIAADGT